LIYNGSNNQCT